MPLATRFWPYRPHRPPDLIGVYELGRANHVLYVGSGVIYARLRAHARNPDMQFQQYRCVVTSDRRRARQIERRELLSTKSRKGEMPIYNKEIPNPP
jgi:hypothetical protein